MFTGHVVIYVPTHNRYFPPFDPLEHALRKELLSTILGADSEDTNNRFWELLAVAGKRGGLGIRSHMAFFCS